MATIVVTGASRGVGLAFVQQLLSRGDEVIAGARRPGQAHDLQALASFPKLVIETLDVADDASVEAFASKLDGKAVDGLINNAGIGDFNGLAQSETKGLLEEYNVNALGPLRVTRALLPHLRRGKDKKVMCLTSLMGSIADNMSGGSYGYRMSKAALNMAAKGLSVDLRSDGITVFVVHPGWVKTSMGGTGAKLTPEESVRGLLAVYDRATRESSGKFFNYDGREFPW